MPKRTRRKSTSDPDRTSRLIHFFQFGFYDFVGARCLLIERLPLQGAILASTSVEKYFKGLLAIRGEVIHGHLQKAHFNSLENYLPDLFARLNPRFLSFLQRVYSLRYADRIPAAFNLKVFARETLAELDHTIDSCECAVNVHRDGEPVATAYRGALSRRLPSLIRENHVLAGQPKELFLKHPDVAYAMLHRGAAGLLEAEFTTRESPTDGDFERYGIRAVPPEEIQAKIERQGPSGA